MSCLSTEETNLTQQKQTTQKSDLNLKKPKPTVNFYNRSHVCVSLCTTVTHNTAQNSSDNLLSGQSSLL